MSNLIHSEIESITVVSGLLLKIHTFLMWLKVIILKGKVFLDSA